MIYHTDFDKAHRCPLRGEPECANGYVSSEETDWCFKRWHVYTCNECGLRVARIPLLPHHPRSGYTYRWRLRWFWWHRPLLRWSNWYRPHYTMKLERLWYGRRKAPEGVDIYITRTPWQQRLIWSTGPPAWRNLYPYVFHRWDVMASSEGPNAWGIDGWLHGFWRRSSAEAYMAECLKKEENE